VQMLLKKHGLKSKDFRATVRGAAEVIRSTRSV
jgi:hypothetical protein